LVSPARHALSYSTNCEPSAYQDILSKGIYRLALLQAFAYLQAYMFVEVPHTLDTMSLQECFSDLHSKRDRSYIEGKQRMT
jgi:hypothetical protein